MNKSIVVEIESLIAGVESDISEMEAYEKNLESQKRAIFDQEISVQGSKSYAKDLLRVLKERLQIIVKKSEQECSIKADNSANSSPSTKNNTKAK